MLFGANCANGRLCEQPPRAFWGGLRVATPTREASEASEPFVLRSRYILVTGTLRLCTENGTYSLHFLNVKIFLHGESFSLT